MAESILHRYCLSQLLLLPGMTMIWLLPCSSTITMARPVADWQARMPGVCTPADWRLSSSVSPKLSPPTQPIMLTSLSFANRPAATAWLAPLPPGM